MTIRDMDSQSPEALKSCALHKHTVEGSLDSIYPFETNAFSWSLHIYCARCFRAFVRRTFLKKRHKRNLTQSFHKSICSTNFSICGDLTSEPIYMLFRVTHCVFHIRSWPYLEVLKSKRRAQLSHYLLGRLISCHQVLLSAFFGEKWSDRKHLPRLRFDYTPPHYHTRPCATMRRTPGLNLPIGYREFS